MPCLALPGLTLHGPSWPNFELAFLRFLGLPGFAWPCQAVLCPPWPGLDLSGLALPCLGWPCLDWPCIALLCLFLHGLVLPCVACPCVALSGLALHCISLPGLTLPGMGMHCLALPCLALRCLGVLALDLPGLDWFGIFFLTRPLLAWPVLALTFLACLGLPYVSCSSLDSFCLTLLCMASVWPRLVTSRRTCSSLSFPAWIFLVLHCRDVIGRALPGLD